MKTHRLFTISICVILFLQILLIPQINSYPSFLQKGHSDSRIQTNDTFKRITQIKTIFNNVFSHTVFPIDSDDPSFRPRNLTDSDDAYHNTNNSYATEWWYFDTTFNQDYSLQFGIHVYEILSTGFAQIQCHIYEKGKKIISENTIKPLSNIHFSTKKPLISFDDQILMKTKNSTIDSSMHYQITYTGTNYSFNLSFQGTTQGWKGTTNAGDWAVVLPKAMVTGKIFIENKTQSVFGLGYHDHNWNVTISAGMNFGWLWGKTNIDQYTLTWATIFETWYKKNPLLVINKDYNGYNNILKENIDFSITEIEFKNGKIIPYGYHLEAKQEDIELSISINVLDTDYITVLGIINYWRYHTHATGHLKIGEKTISINDHNIAEFMRFRPY